MTSFGNIMGTIGHFRDVLKLLEQPEPFRVNGLQWRNKIAWRGHRFESLFMRRFRLTVSRMELRVNSWRCRPPQPKPTSEMNGRREHELLTRCPPGRLWSRGENSLFPTLMRPLQSPVLQDLGLGHSYREYRSSTRLTYNSDRAAVCIDNGPTYGETHTRT